MEDNIYILYQKFLDNSCTTQELNLLFRRFSTVDENKLREIVLSELSAISDEFPATIEEAARLGNARKILHAEINRRHTSARILIFKLSAAAAIIVVVTFLMLLYVAPVHKQNTFVHRATSGISPGRPQATLTLAGGKKIILNKLRKDTLATLGQIVVVVKPADGLYYLTKHTGSQLDTSYNTLATARGEQSPYPLILADGSKVWLNAASSITFPTQFNKRERVVKISGEAYFEVAHNKHLPFKVLTGTQEIMVLGTHFNVKSYADDNTISTTLLQGSVKVRPLSAQVFSYLSPGQQSKFNKLNGQLLISQANMEEAIAWKNGFFMFDDQKITSIMKSMSRWYDVEVEYKNFSNNERFGGTFSRSSSMTDILKSLQSLGKVRFETQSRKIIVSN